MQNTHFKRSTCIRLEKRLMVTLWWQNLQ